MNNNPIIRSDHSSSPLNSNHQTTESQSVLHRKARRLTEPAVVLPRALHGAVGVDLEVEAGSAVELPPAEDALQVAEIREAPGQPLRRQQLLALLLALLLPQRAQSSGTGSIIVHSPCRGKDEMGAGRRRYGTGGTEAIKENA